MHHNQCQALSPWREKLEITREDSVVEKQGNLLSLSEKLITPESITLFTTAYNMINRCHAPHHHKDHQTLNLFIFQVFDEAVGADGRKGRCETLKVGDDEKLARKYKGVRCVKFNCNIFVSKRVVVVVADV